MKIIVKGITYSMTDREVIDSVTCFFPVEPTRIVKLERSKLKKQHPFNFGDMITTCYLDENNNLKERFILRYKIVAIDRTTVTFKFIDMITVEEYASIYTAMNEPDELTIDADLANEEAVAEYIKNELEDQLAELCDFTIASHFPAITIPDNLYAYYVKEN